MRLCCPPSPDHLECSDSDAISVQICCFDFGLDNEWSPIITACGGSSAQADIVISEKSCTPFQLFYEGNAGSYQACCIDDQHMTLLVSDPSLNPGTVSGGYCIWRWDGAAWQIHDTVGDCAGCIPPGFNGVVVGQITYTGC